VKDASDSVPRTIPVGPQLNHCAADVPRLSHRLSEDSERPVGSRRSARRWVMMCSRPAALLRQSSLACGKGRLGPTCRNCLPCIDYLQSAYRKSITWIQWKLVLRLKHFKRKCVFRVLPNSDGCKVQRVET